MESIGLIHLLSLVLQRQEVQVQGRHKLSHYVSNETRLMHPNA